MANSNPGFFDGQTPDASVWNAIFTGKVDEQFGNIVNPTISGTVAGTFSFSGTITVGALGAANFTANGTTAVSLTSIAPAGAHATVQEWLTIKDASGTVRYIPCF